MQLTSPSFMNQTILPLKYKNRSPAFMISDVPAGTVSLALLMHDPDGYRQDFLHWVIWNIPPSTTHVLENTVPDAATEGLNSKGKARYMGPAPLANTGVHHYLFELYALNARLDLSGNAERTKIEAAITEHTIAQTTLVGLFSR